MSMKEKYLEEYEKYKDIEITTGDYSNKDGIRFSVLSINEEEQKAEVQTTKSGVIKTRTLHWCRKNLRK